MKKLLTILFLFISIGCLAQWQPQTLGTKGTKVVSKGLLSADSAMIITNYPDTATANRGTIKDQPGAHIKTSDNKEYYRNSTATAWIYIPDFVKVNTTITDSLNKLNTALENGGPPGYDLLRQKNDSTIQVRSLYFPFGFIGDTLSFGDSVFALKPDTVWFSQYYLRRADSNLYVSISRLRDTAAAIRAAFPSAGSGQTPLLSNINANHYGVDSGQYLYIQPRTGTPGTNTYALWNTTNSGATGYGRTLSNTNHTITYTNSFGNVGGVIDIDKTFGSSGKPIIKVHVTAKGGGANGIGIMEVGSGDNVLQAFAGQEPNTIGWNSGGDIYQGNSVIASCTGWANGDDLWIALDLAAGSVKFFNGTTLKATITGLTGTWVPIVSGQDNTPVAEFILNAGDTPLGTLPAGGWDVGWYTSSGSGVVYNIQLATDSNGVGIGQMPDPSYKLAVTGAGLWTIGTGNSLTLGNFTTDHTFISSSNSGGNGVIQMEADDSTTDVESVILVSPQTGGISMVTDNPMTGAGNVFMQYSDSVTINFPGFISTALYYKFSKDTFQIRHLPSAVGNKQVRYNTATGMFSQVDTVSTFGGSIANTQVAVGSGTNTIAGSSAFTVSSGAVVASASLKAPYIYGGDMSTVYSGYTGGVMGGTGVHGVLDFVDNNTRIGEFYTTANDFNFFTTTSKALYFYTNSSMSVPLIAGAINQKVGINIAAPDSTFQVNGGLRFVTGREGAGKVLTSSASGGADWSSTIAATSVPLSGITAASAFHLIDNVNNQQIWSWNSLNNGYGLSLASGSTAETGSSSLLSSTLTGAHANSSVATIAGDFNNQHTGTSSTNIGIKAQATGGTNNYAFIVPSGSGSVGIGNPAPNSTLDVRGGSFALNYVGKTTTYTATATDQTIDCTGGGTFNVTLPSAVGCQGRIYTIKNSGAGVITVATTSSQNIDVATTYTLAAIYKYVTVMSTNSAWIVIANN